MPARFRALPADAKRLLAGTGLVVLACAGVVAASRTAPVVEQAAPAAQAPLQGRTYTELDRADAGRLPRNVVWLGAPSAKRLLFQETSSAEGITLVYVSPRGAASLDARRPAPDAVTIRTETRRDGGLPASLAGTGRFATALGIQATRLSATTVALVDRKRRQVITVTVPSGAQLPATLRALRRR